MIKAIVSGFQIGSDLSGITTAKELGIKTFGYVPKGYRTLEGNKPSLKEFGALETSSYSYATRTFLNVKTSDGTIRFANNFKSSGELCTLRAIIEYKKPYFDFDLKSSKVKIQIKNAIEWIKTNNIEILNVAGNAGKDKEETYMIFTKVKKYLIEILNEVGFESINTKGINNDKK